MRIEIQALTAELTEAEIRRAVSPKKLEAIKGKGKLVPYVLAQEGTSKPKVLGSGAQVLRWSRSVIQAMTEKIKTGVKFFRGHGVTNSHKNRLPVGELVGKFAKRIRGKLSSVVVAYFPDPKVTDDCDICSMEADVYTDSENNVRDVLDLSGVALASSNQESPAFAGARRLASIQCFGDPDGETVEENKGGGTASPEKSEADNRGGYRMSEITFDQLMSVPLSRIRTVLNERNVHPSQVFDESSMKDDKIMGKYISKVAELTESSNKLQQENEKLKTDYETELKSGQIRTAKERLEKLFPKGITDKKKNWILDEFDPEKAADLTDDGLKNFYQGAEESFSRNAKFFGGSEASTLPEPEGGSEDGAEEAKSEIDKANDAFEKL